jgi:molybdate transport system substrate-binding protein
VLRRILLILAVLVAVAAAIVLGTGGRRSDAPLVLAAASLQESLNAAADVWAAKGHERPVLSFAGTSALARQVEAGAPADLFVSADEEWMDVLARKGLIVPESRETFLANRLVLVTAADNAGPIAVRRMLVSEPVAMADPGAVPAGKYGKAALQAIGLWEAVRPHVVAAENVRAAMALVERGAAPLGIVYATDAQASDEVRVVYAFPEESHPAITYPVARLKTSTSPDAEAFRRFLVSSEGKTIFSRFGFTPR